MPSFSGGQYVQPGVFSQQLQATTPIVPGGVRTCALIGTVIPTVSVTGESVTHGTYPGATDDLANLAVSLGTTIQDINFKLYTLGVDYVLSGGDVSWAQTGTASLTGTGTAPFAGLVLNSAPWTGTSFSVSLVTNPLWTSPSTVSYSYSFVPADFASPSAATASEVAAALTGNHALTGTLDLINGNTAVVGAGTSFTTQLVVGSVITDISQPTFFATVASITDNTHLTLTAGWTGSMNGTATVDRVGISSSTLTVTASSNHVVITTVATKNIQLAIGNGTANSILGFVGGSAQNTPQEPNTGTQYFVNYTYTKTTANYNVQLAFSMQDVTNYAGPVSVDMNNNPLYTLPVAAQIAINNGASVLYLVGLNPSDGATLTQFQRAIDKLQAVNCNIVVPITFGLDDGLSSTAASVRAYAKAHVDTMSSTLNRKERTAYTGTSVTDIPTVVSLAEALADKRVLLCQNNQETYFIGTAATASVLDGSYTAAAIAGIRTNPNFDVATPLTHKPLVGFNTFPDVLLQNQKNTLASNGVLVISNANGANPIVMDGTSTLRDTVDDEEISVTEATDFVIQTVRTLLEAIYVGQKILPDTPSQVVTTTGSILTDLVNLTIINDFSGISATVDSGNPSQIDLSFTILSVYELKYIFVTFGLAL